MSLAIACLLSLALAAAEPAIDASPEEPIAPLSSPPVYLTQAGAALEMKWELPNSRSDEPFEAICTFWPKKPGKPSVGFTIVREAGSAIEFRNTPFGKRIWALTPPGSEGYLVTRIFPTRTRDSGKYVCVLTTECCATPAWTHLLHVFSRHRS